MEVFILVDKIGIMKDGLLIVYGEICVLYQYLFNCFVVEFLGCVNIFFVIVLGIMEVLGLVYVSCGGVVICVFSWGSYYGYNKLLCICFQYFSLMLCLVYSNCFNVIL